MEFEPTGAPMLMVKLAKSSLDTNLRNGIAIVSHNADRTGAPLIALNIARELVKARAIPVATISLEPGELEPEFAQLGPLFVARPRLTPAYLLDPRAWARPVKRAIYVKDSVWHDRFWRRVTKYLATQQIRYALCNTVLSGTAAIRLKHAGLASIGLVHEMPHSIRANRWTDHAAALIQGVQSLVFPCPQVQAAFTGTFPIGDKPSHVYPQSCNTHPEHLAAEQRTASRSALRRRLGLAGDDILILGCGGSGDFRKGVDLFAHAAREMAVSSTMSPTQTPKIVFAWAGHIGSGFREWAEKDMTELALPDRLIFLGPQQDMAPCFAAADLFFLSSREDPFPTTVLEAMAYGLPVVGLAGSGGVEQQICEGVGVIVPYGHVTSAVKVLRRLAEQPDERNRMARLGRERIALSGGYPAYVGNLIEVLLGLPLVEGCAKRSDQGRRRA
jgi:glycosyltransferase involved in cell wall biosynthesis